MALSAPPVPENTTFAALEHSPTRTKNHEHAEIVEQSEIVRSPDDVSCRHFVEQLCPLGIYSPCVPAEPVGF